MNGTTVNYNSVLCLIFALCVILSHPNSAFVDGTLT